MPALIDIRRRIRSVKNTQQITKAMKMVSAAKLRRAQEAMFAARPYARKMMQVLNSLASRAQPELHPLLQEHGDQKLLLVVVTSTRACAAASTPTSCAPPRASWSTARGASCRSSASAARRATTSSAGTGPSAAST
jgi:F-type H+-transporting ATPase subunit gamma